MCIYTHIYTYTRVYINISCSEPRPSGHGGVGHAESLRRHDPRHIARGPSRGRARVPGSVMQTESLEFGGFDRSRFLFSRGGIPRSLGNFTAILTQRFLVCGLLVCGVTISGVQVGVSPVKWNQPDKFSDPEKAAKITAMERTMTRGRKLAEMQRVIAGRGRVRQQTNCSRAAVC